MKIDLEEFINAPDEIKCISCKSMIQNPFDDLEIGVSAHVEGGSWSIKVSCEECDHSFLANIICDWSQMNLSFE
jgi:hypothetical protein